MADFRWGSYEAGLSFWQKSGGTKTSVEKKSVTSGSELNNNGYN
jgi:hypothetical protein